MLLGISLKNYYLIFEGCGLSLCEGCIQALLQGWLLCVGFCVPCKCACMRRVGWLRFVIHSLDFWIIALCQIQGILPLTSQALRRCGISFASSLGQEFGFILKLKLTTSAWIYSGKLITEVHFFSIVEVQIRLPHFCKTFCCRLLCQNEKERSQYYKN